MEQKEPTKYEIKTVSDFLLIPADKRDAALADFRQWIDLCAEIKKELPSGVTVTPGFTWVDDGESGVGGINITVLPGKEDRESR